MMKNNNHIEKTDEVLNYLDKEAEQKNFVFWKIVRILFINRTILAKIPGVATVQDEEIFGRKNTYFPKLIIYAIGLFNLPLLDSEERHLYASWKKEFDTLTKPYYKNYKTIFDAIKHIGLRLAVKNYVKAIHKKKGNFIFENENFESKAHIIAGHKVTCHSYGLITETRCDIVKGDVKPDLKIVDFAYEKKILVKTYGYDPEKVIVKDKQKQKVTIFASQNIKEWTDKTINFLQDYIDNNPDRLIILKMHPGEEYTHKYIKLAEYKENVILIRNDKRTRGLFEKCDTLITYYSTVTKDAHRGGCKEIISLQFDYTRDERIPKQIKHEIIGLPEIMIEKGVCAARWSCRNINTDRCNPIPQGKKFTCKNYEVII